MSLEIRSGSIDELVAINNQIEEFVAPYDKSVFEQRLTNRKWCGLIAILDSQPAGFKLGYEESPRQFYSWLGGVIPAARGHGIARTLLHRQEDWAKAHGYAAIRVKSRNRYANMLRLLISENYNIVDLTPADTAENNRVHFLKHLD